MVTICLSSNQESEKGTAQRPFPTNRFFGLYAVCQLVIVVQVVSLLLGSELTQGVDNSAVLPLAVIDFLGGTHNGNVSLTAAVTDMVPVDEVDVSEFAAIQLAVLNGHGLAAAEEDGAQVAIGIHGGVVAGLVNIAAELCVDGAGMTIVAFVDVVGDHLAHDVQQVVLQELQVEGVDVVRALLNHDGAGGVVGNDCDGTVHNAGILNDLHDFLRDVVESGDPAAGLQFQFLLINFKFHNVFLHSIL